jgi:hypothetical protein
LERLHPTPRPSNGINEDDFCIQLQGLGAQFHKSDAWYLYAINGDAGEIERSGLDVELNCTYPETCPPLPKTPLPVYYGYPSSGGMWVLQLVHKKEFFRVGMGKLKMVLTMDEKCRVIEMLGGEFHSDVEKYWKKKDKGRVNGER